MSWNPNDRGLHVEWLGQVYGTFTFKFITICSLYYFVIVKYWFDHNH